jgi:PKD repeat protein
MILQDPYYLENFATDHYYACMDGPADYVADMASGRIAATTLADAMIVVRKMINYEKNPPSNSAFYTGGLNCAYFQDDDTSGYESRCFSRTAEDVRNYMLGQGFKVKRVYNAKNYITPTNWNNSFYYNGEPMPDSLKKPAFPWNGATADIKNELNSTDGKLFVFHRDHGFKDITNTGNYTGWSTPKFDCSDVGTLTNGDKLPVVFSINCYTGKFMFPICLAQKFLQKTNGGGVGVFAAANMSLSGPNDGLSEGLFDAIWSNPGLVAHFTGFGADPQGTPTPHAPIFTMGDVLNQGLIRMVQTWGNDKYTFEIMHYFGDPAMKIWTAQPVAVTAVVQDSMHCKDTVYTISSSNCDDCLATLVVDGVLYSETQLSGGTGTLHFPAFTGGNAILTLSKHNYKPFIKNIPVQNNCLKAKFTVSANSFCTGENIVFTNASTGSIISYNWNFGADAVPATANSVGPHAVSYLTSGYKTVTLKVKSATDSAVYSQQVYIEPFCSYLMPYKGYSHIGVCNGVLYDNGGDAGYSVYSADTTTIQVTGSSNITLNIVDFDVQAGSNGSCNRDKLEIYDGPNTISPLIGSYCNTQGHFPPNTLTSSTGAITFRFVSDSAVNGRGFKIEWNCAQNDSAPNPNFYATPVKTCTGEIEFFDISTNNPTSWHWDFGDGETSPLQNPTHIYNSNGSYTVSLKATNSHGNNTITKADIILVNRPTITEVTHASICSGNSAVLRAVSEGTVNWYETSSGGLSVHTGEVYTTPVLTSDKTYWVDVTNNSNGLLLPIDTTIGAGLFYAGTTTHYLIFDCYQTVKLLSVKVFAKTSGNRQIKLLDASDNILKDTTISIPQGESRVGLNFNIPAGYNYKLVCPGANNLYRNSTGAVYPYRIDGHISINASSFTNPSYYYFFYNWEIDMPQCISPRIPVNAVVYDSVPLAQYTYVQNDNVINFINTSHHAASYYWDFDDGSYSGLISPTHTYNNNGTYHVKLKATNPCDSAIFVNTINVYTVGVEKINANVFVSVFPNPVSDELSIRLNSYVAIDVEIILCDILGQELWNERVIISSGLLQKSINMKRFASGIYFVKIVSSDDQFVKKIVKY